MEQEEQKTLITRMIQQHRNLQKEIELVVELVAKETVDTVKVVETLTQFGIDLAEHLTLENEKFYPELLEGMKAKGQNTTKTKMFIAEMTNIEKVVTEFLTGYRDEKSVSEKLENLKTELSEIVEALVLRIESEEAGVYSYWGLF